MMQVARAGTRAGRVVAVIASSVLVGCSFIGASVPARPPPPSRCPGGVIAADLLGTSLVLVPALAGAASLALDYQDDRDVGQGALALFAIIPMTVVGFVYLGSTVHGFRARSRCQAMQREQLVIASQPAPPVQRADEQGTAPLHCAITAPDTGACFRDAAACSEEVARAGGACELRTSAWCFDAQGIVETRAQTVCAASRVDCDARRGAFSRDRSTTVTTCGHYAAPAPTSAPATPSQVPASPTPPAPPA